MPLAIFMARCIKLFSCERTPSYRGGSFLLQREQHHGLRRVAAAYTLSTGVDSRATHGISELQFISPSKEAGDFLQNQVKYSNPRSVSRGRPLLTMK